jgi:putative hydrolase of the HAD superfamily
MKKALFWDFDGTLVQSTPLWSASLLRALKGAWPGCPCTIEDVRPHLRSGFPWHTPCQDHSGMTGEAWWETMYCRFEKVCIMLGANDAAAVRAARSIRDILLLAENYALFDDTLPVLRMLCEMGFSQYIVSNNHPDLRKVLDKLDLSIFFEDVIVSGEIGFDKPRKEIFEYALQKAGNPGICIMIGDNPVADGEGASAANIPPLLVHVKEPCAFSAFETLSGAIGYIREELHADTHHDTGRL